MDDPQHLSPPQKDFRKYSLPLSTTSHWDRPELSLTKTNPNAIESVAAWQTISPNIGMKTTEQQDFKINWTVNDEDGQEITNSLFDSVFSSLEETVDNQDLGFEDNFSISREADDFDQLNERFLRKLHELDDENVSKVIREQFICKKCGHDITELK